ncbi:MAG: hypothetical protein ACI4SS_03155, partial [Clostridia bacterium]
MKRNFIAGFVSGAVAFSVVGAVAANLTASPNTYPVKLDGKEVSIEGYNVDNYTYFKLRDIADTVGGFEVDFKDDAIILSTDGEKGTISLKEQGMFSAGGTVITSDGTFDPENHWEETGAGQTSHVDHANVLYQIPENETGLPMVFLHGYGQSRMGWMTTPDGREGWSDMFLKKG